MIKLKTLTVKNFLSVGAVTQTINLEDVQLTLVLGENLDLGSAGSRNGVGKSLVVQAICFALFGQPLTQIKLNNLINKTNSKGMVVSIEFDKGGNSYKVERGRSPMFTRFFVNDSKVNTKDEEGEDEAQGDNRETQKEINKVLGFSKDIFKHIIALNTFTQPFLSEGAHTQRVLIEELFGVTQLSQKAEVLKEKAKDTKDKILTEEVRIKSIQESNQKIQNNIDQLKLKSSAWDKSKEKNIKEYIAQIEELEHVDIDLEIENHKIVTLYTELEKAFAQFEKGYKSETTVISRSKKQLESINKQIESAEEHSCPMCGNTIHDEKHHEIMDGLIKQKQDITEQLENAQSNLEQIQTELEQIEEGFKEIGNKPSTFYKTPDEAYNHRSRVENLKHRLEHEEKSENPYVDQIDQLTDDGIQTVSYDLLNELTTLKDHQLFLVKLLTDKGSFIRKKIIDQNLSYLNHRLNNYLEKLGLPHEVRFLNDLSVEITELGRDFDFDNLSRGEKNRLILGLSFAFRDVWESLNDNINLIFIDELIDNGTDQAGVDNALTILKSMARDRNKDIFLISHRDELLSRVQKVLVVKKEAGFTQFTDDANELEN